MKIVKKQYILLLLLPILLLSFYQTAERIAIQKAYLEMLPNLKTEPLKVLPALELLLKKGETALEKSDTLLANLYYQTAKVYCDKNISLTKGVHFYRKALEIQSKNLPPNHPKLGATLHNLALGLRTTGAYQEAKNLELRAIDVKSAAAKPDTASIMRSYAELATCNQFLGDFENAKTNAQKVLELATYLKDTFNLSGGHLILGSTYLKMGQFVESEKEYQLALNIYQQVEKNGSLPPILQKEKAGCLNNLGIVAREMKQFDVSVAYFTASKTTFLRLMEVVKDSTWLLKVGNVALETGNTEGSRERMNDAMNNYSDALKNFGNLRHPYVVECYTAIGEVYLKQNNLDLALKNYQKATESGGSEDNYFPELLTAFTKKAKVLALKGELKLAFETYQKCDTIIQKLQQSYQADNSKYRLADKALPIYEQGIATALMLYEKNKTPQYLDAAVRFCEKNKAIILLENLRDNKAKNFAGVPDSVLQEEKNLKSDVAYWEKQIYETPDSLKFKYKNDLFNAKETLDRFVRNLEKNYPKYAELKYQQAAFLGVSEIQKTLDKDVAAVEYFMGDSVLYVFSFTNKDFKYFIKKTPPQYFADFQRFRQSLKDEKLIADSAAVAENYFLTSGHNLYQFLLKEPLDALNVGGKITRLRIIPDGILGYLPFELLPTEIAATWKGKNVPYLLKKYAVSYLYANQLLQNKTTQSGDNNFGGFGIEYNDTNLLKRVSQDTVIKRTARSGILNRLIFAPDEVRNIAKLLGGGQLYLNADATKLAFLRDASGHSILHLAMHGAIDDKNPLNSGLIFSKKDSIEDNYLSGYDLFAMQMKTGLAVLSACNTGNGALRKGEGVMSLARAFAFAGCPSMVMSLWSIPDESTSKVMLAFYKNLKNGDTKDVALQKAKLEYLQNCPPQYSVPNYWGATVVIGNVETIDFRPWYLKPKAIFLLGLLAFVAVVFGLRHWR